MPALDTNALIFCIEGPKSDDPERRKLGQRVRCYLSRLADSETPVGLPAVVVGEFLRKYEVARFDTVIEVLGNDFLVWDFDLVAAKHLAEILKDGDAVAQARASSDRTSTQIKIDAVVAATAVTIQPSERIVASFRRFLYDDGP